MLKVFITGAAGLLGGNLSYLYNKRFETLGNDVHPVSIPGVKLSAFDLTETNLTEDFLKKERPHAIIHCMALTNIDVCEDKPELAYSLNVNVTKRLADTANDIGAKMIYISTDAVFDGQNNEPYTETDKPNPVSIYAKTKLEGEEHTLRYEKNTVLRTNIFGFNILNKYSLGEWALYGLQGGETLGMFHDVYFSPILVNDLAEIIAQCIEKDAHGLYHACGTGSLSKYDFGCLIKEEFGMTTGYINKTSVDDFGFRAKRTKNMTMDNSKLAYRLGISISTPQEAVGRFKQLFDSGYGRLMHSFK